MKDQQLDQKASNKKGRNHGNAWAKILEHKEDCHWN
jgi:hypothetical protein